MEIEKKQQLSMYDQSSYFCPPPPSQAAVVVPPMSFSGFTPMISSSSEEINHHNHHHHQNYCPHHLGLDMKQDFYNGQSMMANPDSLYNLSFEEYPINGAASSSSFEYALQYGFPGSLYDHEREGTTIGMGGGGDSELLGLECGLMERRRGRGGGGGGGGGDMGKVGFASEKQRREKISEKYEALRSMIPNPTKVDRASIIADATDYIKELLRTVDELKLLVEKKRYRNERLRRLKNGEDPVATDMESSSSLRPLGEAADQDRILNEPLRSSWLQRKSKETTVDVRIVDDEVTIKLSQRKRSNCLLSTARILHELHLELLHVAGGNIGDYHIFMFNTKIYEGSSVYASAIAKKLIEVVDRQYTAIHF